MGIAVQENEQTITLTINKHLKIRVKRRVIYLKEINGFGHGSINGRTIYPTITCLVKEEQGKYILLNYGDQRVSNLALNEFNCETKIEVVIVPKSHIEKVAFIAGKLIPQQTPTDVSIQAFLDELIRKPRNQEMIVKYFTDKRSRSDAKIAFNLQQFLSLLGKNAIKLSNAQSILQAAAEGEAFVIPKPHQRKIESASFQEDLISFIASQDKGGNISSTQKEPTPLPLKNKRTNEGDKSNTHEETQQNDEPVVLLKEPDTTSFFSGKHDENDNSNTQDCDNQPEVNLDIAGVIYFNRDSPDLIWNQNSKSKYSYQDIERHLSKPQALNFYLQIRQTRPNTKKFEEFVYKYESILDESISRKP